MERKFGKLKRKIGNEVYETVPFVTSQDIFTSETGTKYDGQNLNVVIGDLLNGFSNAATADLTNVDNEVFKAKAKEADVSGLPDYTSENDGEFLKIVNGIPTWVSVTSAEEVSY